MKAGFFDSTDGLKLYADWYAPEAGTPRAGVVLMHGYADHSGRYAHVGKRLAASGYAVMGFDYRGHGQAGGRRGHCDAFDEYLGDFERACARVRDAVGGRPLVVVAHSHGALIALRALCDPTRVPTGVAALAVASPYLGLALKVSPLKVAAGRLASRLAPRLTLKNEIVSEDLSHDPEMVAAHRADRDCHAVATARWFTEATRAQEWVGAHAAGLALPSLWLVAGEDRIADPAVTRRVFAAAGGDKRLELYAGFFHEVFHERDRDRVLGDLERWLSPRFPEA